MGRPAKRISHPLCSQVLQQLLTIRVWHNRSLVLRKFLQRSWLRHDVATLPRRRGMGPVHGRRMGLQFRLRIRLGLGVSMGMDALSLRHLGFPSRIRLGMATGRCVEQLVFATYRSQRSEVIRGTACAGFWDQHSGREPGTSLNLHRKQIDRPEQFGRTGCASRPVWEYGKGVAKGSAARSGQPARGCATGCDACFFIWRTNGSAFGQSGNAITCFAAYVSVAAYVPVATSAPHERPQRFEFASFWRRITAPLRRLTLLNRDPVLWIRGPNVVGARSDQAIIIELLDNMRAPAADA